MQMTGDVVIPASRETVWQALNDPEILRQAIPGCESIEKLSDTEMTAKVGLKIGPVKASFGGSVTLSDLDPPNGYRISGQGQGGAAGFAKGGATVRLEEVEGGTRLSYEVDAQVGGKLAQIGSRLIDGAAKSLAGEFFTKFSGLVGTPAADAEEAGEDGEIEDVPPPPTELASPATADEAKAMDEAAEAVEEVERSLPPAVWIGILLLLVGGILLVVSS